LKGRLKRFAAQSFQAPERSGGKAIAP
jgi:hypothetical protein